MSDVAFFFFFFCIEMFRMRKFKQKQNTEVKSNKKETLTSQFLRSKAKL